MVTLTYMAHRGNKSFTATGKDDFEAENNLCELLKKEYGDIFPKGNINAAHPIGPEGLLGISGKKSNLYLHQFE